MTGLGSLVGALAVTFGLLALAVRLLRRLQHGLGGDSGRVPLQVLRRIPVGPKQNVALLRVADRVLVVSVGDGGTTLLTELTGEACDQALAPATPQTPAAFTMAGAGWLPRLRRALPLVLLLLLVGPRWLPAQTPAARPAPAAVQQPAGPRVTPPAPPQIDIRLGEGSDGLHLSGTVGLVVFMGVLTILPALFLLMTSFTRILIVLHFLRSALGTQTTPPGQLLVAFAVLLTGVVMNPV
ncbi:MAG: flagellar biosynthetic protein FliO, partial [Gemmatimonadales bacterium]